MNILDASALLAFLKKEKGCEVVEKLFLEAKNTKESLFIHQLNFIEVTYCCLHFLGESQTKNLLSLLKSPFLGVINYFDDDVALYASNLKAHYPISLGDAVGLAYTKTMEGKFWTADRALDGVAKKEKITLSLIR